MTEDEFRADLLAARRSRRRGPVLRSREAFVAEVLERLRDAGETPDAEPCAEIAHGSAPPQAGDRRLGGGRSRRLAPSVCRNS